MKPIIFNTQMARAILSGQKTQTRRVVKLWGNHYVRRGGTFWSESVLKYGAELDNRSILLAPYQKGDVLWVRETWGIKTTLYSERIVYRADYSCREEWPEDVRWHPSIHMLKAAARIFLRVTDVRVERLQDIDENGAIAEGLYKGWRLCGRGSRACSARQAFMWLWEKITRKAPAADSWACNPWVWVYTFERIRKEDAG